MHIYIYIIIYIYPIGSMYGTFNYIWVIYGVNVSKYAIHGSYGNVLLRFDFTHFPLRLIWFEDGRDALNLEEFCRWFPTVLGLEPLSPQHIEESLGNHGYGRNLRGLTVGHPKFKKGFLTSVSSQLLWWYWCYLVHEKPPSPAALHRGSRVAPRKTKGYRLQGHPACNGPFHQAGRSRNTWGEVNWVEWITPSHINSEH